MPAPAARRRPASKPRAPRVDHEGTEQAVLIRWLYGEQQRGEPVGAFYDVIYHVPNGGQRNKKTAADLKRQGVKSGVSDLVVMEGRGGWLGLYIEFKATPPNHAATAASQREWLEKADRRGYCAVLARGLEEAKAVLREYASWAPTIIEHREAMPHGSRW
ncbi:VRR-NUC domain-containing protein [Salinicola aestuarinus]|uniref:VRR-NUC domain-containing protein n=1 Tax=Salinicola aestuarinus TaxID=1949082 RepID=UPI000DA1E2F3|nr:VRR-NUC domain-containing protein [Salinicola aestuarinus]